MDTEEYQKVRQIASRLRVPCEQIDAAYYDQTLAALVSGKYQEASDKEEAAYQAFPTESLILLCDFSDKRMDKLLFELRRSEVKVDYKAALTPTNKSWNVNQLMQEMRREKAAYRSALNNKV
ncbi:MAG: DUF3783 domain-containing protein [Lachnospiraceae bacterium]